MDGACFDAGTPGIFLHGDEKYIASDQRGYKKDTGVRSRKARRGLMTRPHKTNRGTHGVPLLVLFIRQ